MRKNIKIKLLNFFMMSNIFILLFVFDVFSQEVKDDDLLVLPGEEVITDTGKKMKVWSSKGTFKLNNNSNNNKNNVSSSIDDKKVIVVVDKQNKRHRRRNNIKAK